MAQLAEIPSARGVYVDKRLAPLMDVKVTLNLGRLDPRDRKKLLKACDYGYLSAGLKSTPEAVYRVLCAQYHLPLIVIGTGNMYVKCPATHDKEMVEMMLTLTGIAGAGSGWLKRVIHYYHNPSAKRWYGIPDCGTPEKVAGYVRRGEILYLARPSGMKPERFMEAIGRQYFPPIGSPENREAARQVLLRGA